MLQSISSIQARDQYHSNLIKCEVDLIEQTWVKLPNAITRLNQTPSFKWFVNWDCNKNTSKKTRI